MVGSFWKDLYCRVHQITISELREVLLVILSGHVKSHHAQRRRDSTGPLNSSMDGGPTPMGLYSVHTKVQDSWATA